MKQKSGQRLILADGTVYENSGCGVSGGTLYCNIRGLHRFQSVTMDFLNPEMTQVITFEAGDVTTVFTGFTEMTSIGQINEETITVALKRSGGE